uniref:Lmo0105 protein n=1 Tax=Ganoderma boninense TaxID=34458 RepID=A0A5K1K3N0_9APHY|nr:Lmo0105 protein [Ganoderma boninense]
MGQDWTILNVDLREQDLDAGGKHLEFFLDGMRSLDQSLRIPCLPKAVDKWLSHGPFVVQPGPVGKLSTEVLDMIFEAILGNSTQGLADNFLNCVFLAVCCKRLLAVSKRHILRALMSIHARAVDCRLVCIGTATDVAEQAPPGMLTDAELQEIATTPIPDECLYHNSAEEAVAKRHLLPFAREVYKSYRKVQTPLFDPLKELGRCLYDIGMDVRTGYRLAPLRALELDMISALSTAAPFYPRPEYPEGPAVLCNMSKGEYVCEETLLAYDTLNSWWEGVTLMNALLLRICYSPSGGTTVWCDDEDERQGLINGAWAGDRFRVTSMAEMPLLEGGRQWKDVTEEVAELLWNIWDCLY